jgi:hypothetical protein
MSVDKTPDRTPVPPGSADGPVRGALPVNEPILIDLRIDATNLTPEERALLRLLAVLPPEELLRGVRMLHHWDRARKPRKALAVKLLDDRLPDKHVAEISGVSARQLRRYREYQRFSILLRRQRRVPPRGCKGRDGRLEAWDPGD